MNNLLKQFEKAFKNEAPCKTSSPAVKECGNRFTNKFLIEQFGDSLVSGFTLRGNDGLLLLTPDHVKKEVFKFSQVFPSIVDKSKRNFYISTTEFSDVKPELQKEITQLQRFGATILNLWCKSEEFRTRFWIGNDTVTATHYDEAENVFMQLKGEKTFTFFPPSDVNAMYCYPIWIERGICSRVDILNPDLNKFPNFKNAKPIVITVKAGDVLLIPRMWFHHVVSKDFSISLSISKYAKNVPQPGCTAIEDQFVIGKIVEGCVYDSWGKEISEPFFKSYSLGRNVDLQYSVIEKECFDFCKQFGVKNMDDFIKIMRWWFKDRFH